MRCFLDSNVVEKHLLANQKAAKLSRAEKHREEESNGYHPVTGFEDDDTVVGLSMV